MPDADDERADTSIQARSLSQLTAIKRPRPVISCLECRRKKLKCDRTYPCRQCLKIGRPGRCEYQAGQEPELNTAYAAAWTTANKRPRLDREPSEGLADNASDARRNSFLEQERREPRRLLYSPAPAAGGVIEDLQERIARLEQALLAQDRQSQQREDRPRSVACQSPPSRSSAVDFNGPDESDHVVRPGTNPPFPDACSFLQHLRMDDHHPDSVDLKKELRWVQEAIEAVRQNGRQRPAFSSIRNAYGRLRLPAYPVCLKLAMLYFDNLEHCFRILHWPEFRDQLGVYFTNENPEQVCKFGFVPQMVGVLAIAATLGTHSECDMGSACPILEPPLALRFIDDFLHSLQDRQRYLLSTLQVKSVGLMLRWITMAPIDDLFHLNGDLLRDALVMKMDQDPSTLPGTSIFQGELRRRLWMTIVECDLMLSILCKLPCMVPPYTCRHPQNVDDDEIYEGMQALPQSRPLEEWTDGLCQYVLSQSFPRRLAACKQMDSSSPGHVKFQDVLLHTRYLERVLQELPPPLRFSYMGDQASKTPPRLMARMELDISIRRPLVHLYSCCASAPNADDIQQEIRAGFLQSCLMLTTFQDLFDPQFSEINVPRPEGYWDFFHNVYRYELGQAILGLCLEIKRLSCATEAHRSTHTVTTERARNTSLNPATSTSTPRPASTPFNGTPNDSATDAGAGGDGPSTGGAGGAPAVRAPSYTKENMIDAVKDILGPMKRRQLHHGASLKDLVYFTVVLTSVLPPQPGVTKEAMIHQALQGLVRDCRAHLEREHGSIVNSEAFQQRHRPSPHPYPASWSVTRPPLPVGPKFDPTWAEFPDLDFLDATGPDEVMRVAVD
ncbi:hypothetical protein A1O1_05262 [Capronia coronata CBS 617.96]|uniref:Zn(2)-C6 fungal-type domain-containing protein n=1 Tax=Capronia coronata CBS 617.96 TaxID=1182541 RepID=W9Y694_9EURO|nr:uncharacterized protein A1O1_05262 [Capronia coronata CBS 617.96]EXJ88332.1 hypothetical protein A1O1_05262 [Capronia coronata CBS 617.96]